MSSLPESEAVLTEREAAAQAPAADTAALESILAPEDARAYRRFLEWSIGGGFKLAIVEVTAPRDRDALVAWTVSAAPGARAVALDDPEQRPVWALLEEACQAPGEAEALVLTRLEELHDRSKVCAQLNIHRDELARAFAVPWVVLVHPSAALDLQRHAPDFCDFASLWMRSRPGDPATTPALLEMRGVERSPEHLASAPVREASDEELLDRAYKALSYGRVNEARDLLAEYDLQHPDARASDPRRMWLEAEQLRMRGEPALAMAQLQAALPLCSESLRPLLRGGVLLTMGSIRESWGELDEAANLYRHVFHLYDQHGDQQGRAVSLSAIAGILYVRGDVDEALRIRQQEVLPVFEKLGDVRSRAVTLSKIADILYARGELDEALRIHQQEVLPAFEKLGDVHARVLTLGKIADILYARGKLDEALRIRQQEVLPAFEKLGDVHLRAVTLGKIADILHARGDLDEALRIRQEVLPIFEKLGDVRSRALITAQIAIILGKRGEANEALRLLQEVLPALEKLGDVHVLLMLQRGLALAHLARGRPGDREVAAQFLELALKGAERLSLPDAAKIRAIQQHYGLALAS